MTPLNPDKSVDVWLAVGQSNVVGSGDDGTVNTTVDLDDQILIWDYSGTFPDPGNVSNGWSSFANWSSGFGPERGFARRIFKRTRRRVAIIKFAANGIPIKNFTSAAPAGYFNDLVTQVNSALAGLDTLGFHYIFKGHICLGHTANAQIGHNATEYFNWLTTQSSDYASRWGAADTPWQIALADHPASWSLYDTTGAPAIRQGIANFRTANSNQVVVVSTAETGHVGDQVHYTSQSKELVGIRMADAIADL